MERVVVWIFLGVFILVTVGFLVYFICRAFKNRKNKVKLTFKQWWQIHKPTKRRLIQIYAALLYNINIGGFINGEIYSGGSKVLCVPGLNCYSCPGAVAACPLGALQNALSSSNKKYPYYVFGIILMYAIIFGRTICGWACPVGLFQELMFSIKSPKLKKNRFTKVLSYLKYVILVLCVIAIPLIFSTSNISLPAFCKYLCPGGTLGGAIFLLAHPKNAGLFSTLGLLFLLKFSILVVFCTLSIFIFRFFCRFFCPLGAIYGLFNKFAPVGVKLNKSACIHCNKCKEKCKMDISFVGDSECINCGECASVCPTNAIKCKGLLVENSEKFTLNKENKENKEIEKEKRKVRSRNIILSIFLIIILIGAGVYYNFLDKSYLQNEDIKVYNVGDTCENFEVNLLSGEKFSLYEENSKVFVINFWATFCEPCIKEMSDFNRVASEFGDVYVLGINTSEGETETKNFATSMGYNEYTMKFGVGKDKIYRMLGGRGDLPYTVILKGKTIVSKFYSFTFNNKSAYENLKNEVEKYL